MSSERKTEFWWASIGERLHDTDAGDIPEYCYAGRQISTAIRALIGKGE